MGVFDFIGNIGSALIGAHSAKKTNDANVQMTRETNEANAKLAKEQNDWNEQMYLKYDSPEARKNQLLQAGYNPLVEFGGANLQSADMANQQAPQRDPSSEANAWTNVGNSVNNVISNLATEAQIQELRTRIKQSEQEMRFAETLFPYEKDLRDYESQIRKYQLNEKEYDFSDPDNVPEEIKKTNAYRTVVARREELEERVRTIKQAYAFAEKMNPHRLRQLTEEIKNLGYHNDIDKASADLARKYGIAPNDDGFLGLIKIGLRDPQAYSKIVDGLLKAVKTTLSNAISHIVPNFFD